MLKAVVRQPDKVVILIVFLASLFLPLFDALALKQLSIEPLTWNVIGLDSNNVSVGPDHFPIGARVCNDGDEALTNVQSSFAFESGDLYSGDPYINLRPGTSSAYTDGVDLGLGECIDFYYEVEVARDSGAYEHTREYYITATADSTPSITTPRPRELFVEYLISQSRNSVSDVLLDGVSVPAGGTMNLVVGDTYEIRLEGFTATNGYEQIESFINFPNTIFQILDVTTTYTADTSAYVSSPDDKLYGDGCLWENDPNSPNYRSCLDVGKAGGTISVTFDVKILSVPTNPLSNPQGLSTLIYDFSGSSYHYNSDYSVSTRYANIVTATITKAFAPKTVHPGDTSTLTFEITNPGTNAISNVNFNDSLPTGLTISNSTVTYTGCGSPTPSSLSIGDVDLVFSDITIAGLSTCTIEVSVTGSGDGVYNNISDNLYIDTVDTGSSADDTLVISSLPPPPSSCAVPVTMATWTLENHTASTSFNTGPFNAFSLAGDVTTAVGTYVPATGSNSAIVTSSTYPTGWDPPSSSGEDGNSWGIQGGWSPDGVPTDPTSEPSPYFEFQVDGSQYGGVGLTTSYNLQNNWSNSGNWYVLYSTNGSTWSTLGTGVWDKSNAWQIDAISAASTSAGDANVYFRVYAAGAQYTGPGGGTTHAEMYLDNITISGCPRPDPPTLSKAFSDTSIPTGSSTVLTFSLTNPNSSDLTGVGFSDDLPTGLLIATPNGLTQSCSPGSLSGGTFTAVPGTTYFELNGATLSADAACTISINVLGDVAGEYENISGNISATETGANTSSTGYGIDSLTVVDPPVISKSFGATYVLTGDTTSLGFSIANPNRTVALSGVAFSDVLPAGLSVADGTFSVCGGTDNLTTVAATRAIQLTSTTIAAGDTCDFSVTVTGSSVGTHVNTTGNVTSTNGGTGNTASATIEVRDPIVAITLLKQVSDSSSGPWSSFLSIGTSSSIYFRFVVENTGDVPLSSVDVTDPASYVDPSTCVWTDGDGDSLTAPFTLPVPSAANEDHIAYCTIGPITTSSTVGSYSNTATASGTYSTTTVSDDSTATYANPEVTIAKTAAPAYYLTDGVTISYTFDVTNSGGVPLLGPVTIDDDKAADENCPSLTTVGDGDNYLDPAETITCTGSYTITITDVSAGSVTNNATATVDSITSNTDSETVYLAALTIDKDTSTPTVGANGLVVYTIEVVNTGQFDLTNFQVTDALPFNSGEFSIQSIGASVTSGTINANGSFDGSADTNLLAGTDTLMAGATATITINIQLNGATTATYDNTAAAVTAQTGSVDDDGTVADDPGTPGAGADPETDEDVTVTGGGTITIIKNSVPDAAQDFGFTGSGPAGYDFGGGFSLDDDADPTLSNTQSFSSLSPGSYTVTEGAVPGWGLTGLSCSDPDNGSSVDLGTQTATIDLDDGETVICTYTNTQLATIVVVKDSAPDNAQDFAFSGSGPSGYDFGGGFSLDDDIDPTLPNTETFADLLPGTYSVTEAAASGWDLTALSCDDPDGGSSGNVGTLTASIDLDSGETVTCTFANTQLGSIEIIKDAVPDDAQDFAFTGTGPSGYNFGGGFSLDDDANGTLANSQTFTGLTPGSYTVTEGAVSGWGLNGLSCSDPDNGSSVNMGTATASIDLDPGETITCTFTNTQFGTIEIIKDAVPDDAQDFAFSGTGPSGYDFGGGFSLDDDSDGTLPNSQSFTGLTPGSYTVTETGVAGWDLTGLTCNDPDNGSSEDVGTLTASIDLDAGETVSCAFTNTQLGTIVITKDSVPDDAQDFAFTGTGPSGYDFGGGFSLDDDADGTLPNSRTFSDLTPGSYSVTETGAAGWDLTGLTCVDPDNGSSEDVGTLTATIDVDPGETVACTYTNTQQNPALTLVKSITSGDPYNSLGDVISYEFELTNTGNVTLDGPFTVADNRASNESCPAAATLAPNASITCTATYTIIQADLDNGTVTNTATASGFFGGNTVTSNQDSQTANATQTPAIQVIKEVSDDNINWFNSVNVLVNDTVYYRVRVANSGNITLTSLTVDDGMADCTLSRGTDITGDNDNAFEVGEVWSYYCDLTAVVGTQTNTATADTNETAPATDTAEYVGVAPPQISKAFSPGTINAGEFSTLTFTITNPNTSTDLTGVQFDDTLPTSPGAMTVDTPANTSTSCGGTVTAVSGSGSISFTGGFIPAGGTCTVQVNVTASVEGPYANFSGFVSAANGGVGNRASASLIVGAAIVLDPAVTKTGNPASAQVGDVVTFALQVFNNGNANAIDVVVTDPLPAFLDYVGLSAPGSTLSTYDLPTNTVTVYYSTVQPTDNFTITITTVVNSLGAPPGGINSVTLSSLTADADLNNNIDSATIEIVTISDLPSPETGFAPDRVTAIPPRPEGDTYLKLGQLSIQIPSLGLETAIVGVPLNESGWDVTWLWNQIGYLEGTAFPGWDGNSVLTGHVYQSNGQPGPFSELDKLIWGDQIIINVYGTRYVYEVRESQLYTPNDNRIIRHEETPWLTLITCQSFDEQTGAYRWRRVVRAVLISVEEIR